MSVIRRRPETRLVPGKSGARRIQVERGPIRPLASLPQPAVVLVAPKPVGSIAVDCENLLRGRSRFPPEFFPAALGGTR